MANPEHLQKLKQGIEAWNQWRSEDRDITPDLGEADLRGADLGRATLHGATLHGANLRGANLRGADLGRGNLGGANLGEADLRGANLRGANLRGANLRGTDLTGANLSRVILDETVLGNTNLTAVQGLETCDHLGPSILDHRTLARSGPLPLAFLRGCGLPEALIEYLPSLLGETIQFYSCFISYSSTDEAFCRRLHGRLQDAGLRVWFAPHDIRGGQKLHEQIDAAIRVYDKLLLVLSPHSIQSPWVEFEIRRARRREVTEQRRLLFPVRLVDYDAIKRWECFDADTCSGLQTVQCGLANRSISRPALCANTPTGGPTLRANGPTLVCKRLANRPAGQHTVRMG
jgi:hypothetical protein